MKLTTKKATVQVWEALTPTERVICNAYFLMSNPQTELEDADWALRFNTCLAASDFPMKKHLEELILKYEVDNP